MFLLRDKKTDPSSFNPWPSLLRRLIEVDILSKEPSDRASIEDRRESAIYEIMFNFRRKKLIKEIKTGLLSIKKMGISIDLMSLINYFNFVVYETDKNVNFLEYLNLKHKKVPTLEMKQIFRDPRFENFVI